MGNSEEHDKSSHTPGLSSPTKPLLSKPYLQSPIEEPREESSERDRLEYLHISYNHDPRQFKDIPFLVLFLLFVAATFAFGIFASAHRNPNSSNISAYHYDSSSTTCVRGSNSSLNRSSSDDLVRNLILTLLITLIFSVPCALFILFLLKHYTKQLVYASLPFFIVLPVFFNVYWFAACTSTSTCSDTLPLVYRILLLIFLFLLIGIIVWIFASNWHRVELTVQIIGVASDALSRNLRLLMVLPCLCLGLVVYLAPIIMFLVFARLNGKIVPRECDGKYKCVWKEDSWVPGYYTLAILTMLWSIAAVVEAQVYVISGTVAQWYFSRDDFAPKRCTRSSLRNAFGPSFGTVCLSGLLIFAVRVVRAVVDTARSEHTHGILYLMLRCCVNAFLAAIDFLNKFTINFVAITGEAYCSSSRATYELLRRNLLSPVFVETISTRLLAAVIYILSSLYAIAVCAVLNASTDLGVFSYVVAGLAWLLMVVILGYFVHVLDNVIDTVYICYAIDRDKSEVCRQEVHEVYVNLPISRSHGSYLLP